MYAPQARHPAPTTVTMESNSESYFLQMSRTDLNCKGATMSVATGDHTSVCRLFALNQGQ